VQTATGLQKEQRNQGSSATAQQHEAAQVLSRQKDVHIEPETSRTGRHQNGATAMARNVTIDLDARETHSQVPRNQGTAPKQGHLASKLARNATVALELSAEEISEEGRQNHKQIQDRGSDKDDRAQTTAHASVHASGHQNAAGDRETNNMMGMSEGSSSSRAQTSSRSNNNNNNNVSNVRAKAHDMDEDTARARMTCDGWHSVCVGMGESSSSVTDMMGTVRTFVPMRASINRQDKGPVDSYNGSAQRQYVNGHAIVSVRALCIKCGVFNFGE
jgi:hypothetical protein